MTTLRAKADRHIPQLSPHRLLRNKQVHHPAVLDEAKRRSEAIQLRLADRITAFAGSMNFVWMLFLEKSPWPTLTLVVSLGDLPVDLRHDRPESPSGLPTCQSRPRLRSPNQHRIDPPIHVLTEESHRRLMDGAA
jgi:hypothetical protein